MSTVKLTVAQRNELRRLAGERQPTYGAARARVQNNLVLAGLARFIDPDGQPLHGVTGRSGLRHVTEWCELMALGRAALHTGDYHKVDRLTDAQRTELTRLTYRDLPATGRPPRALADLVRMGCARRGVGAGGVDVYRITDVGREAWKAGAVAPATGETPSMEDLRRHLRALRQQRDAKSFEVARLDREIEAAQHELDELVLADVLATRGATA